MEILLDLFEKAQRPYGNKWHLEVAIAFRKMDQAEMLPTALVQSIEKILHKRRTLLRFFSNNDILGSLCYHRIVS